MTLTKRILSLSLAVIMLFAANGFAVHTTLCLMTGDLYPSPGAKKCCCESPKNCGSKCCQEHTEILKIDLEALQVKLDKNACFTFFAAFVYQYLYLIFSPDRATNLLKYSKYKFPAAGQDVIVLVQSFLL